VDRTRRQLLTGIPLVGAGALIAACRPSGTRSSETTSREDRGEYDAAQEAAEVAASEDLMREHGILRRALLVYKESAIRLRQDITSVPPDTLEKTAQLFRVFGEDYHERKLEETYIFPALRQTQNPAAVYADVLTAQHARGREITDYLLALTALESIPTASANDFISALESFVRMYEHHAAVEDTLVFPSWRRSLSRAEFDEMGARFEEIEQEQFGEDGFEAALRRMAEIEESLGLSDLATFTADAPPARK
jgi:hemerythrin-like domain-containing protein